MVALVILAGLLSGCGDAVDRGAAGAYDAAITAALDSLRLPAERLVFPHRFISLESFMDSEPGPRSVFEDLAARYPASSVCAPAHAACIPEPEPGETMVFVSRLAEMMPGEVALAVVTYHYTEGNVFGDGFRMRLTYDGERWIPLRVVREWVPE
jgi:hypothetical protein